MSISPSSGVEETVVLACAVTLALVCLWLLVSTALCLADLVARRPAAPADRRAVPSALFRPPFLVAFLALALGPLAAAADPAPQRPRRPDLPRLLDGLTLPERPAGGVELHRIRVGESLWSIAADHLPGGAGPDRVARTWPRIHRLNQDRIGPDPDLVLPGTALRLPVVRPTRPAPDGGASR